MTHGRPLVLGPALLAALLLGGCGPGSPPASSAAAGKADAARDLQAGLLQLREPPIPAPAWWGPYHDKLKQIGVSIVVVDHKGSPALDEADNAYNAVMTGAIEKKHGSGIVGRLRQEAQKEHEERVKSK